MEVIVHDSTNGEERGIGGVNDDVLLALAIGIIIICLAAVQIGPGRVRKPFRKDRK